MLPVKRWEVSMRKLWLWGLVFQAIDTQVVVLEVMRSRVSRIVNAFNMVLTYLDGLSYFSYARGFVCDDVVNFEVVLASGEILNANAKTNSDLWLALKGGGNNFGIVTRFELNLFDLAQMWGGKLFYFQPSFPGQIQSLVEYLHDPNADTGVHICLSLGYAAALGDIICMNDIFCTRPERPKALEPFASIQPQIDEMNTLRVDNLKSFTDEAFSGASSNR